MTGPMLQNGAELWDALLESGLLPRKSTGTAGYDESVERELNAALFPSSCKSLATNLASDEVSTERFLDAFFKVVQPFSVMLRDTLAMFEAASAKRGEKNLKISFNFENITKELVVTLQHFRQIEERVRLITRPAIFRDWNTNTLWGLSRGLNETMEGLGIAHIDRSFGDDAVLRDHQLADWISKSGRPTWLDFPGIQPSGYQRLDEQICEAEALVKDMLAAIRKLGETYREFESRLRELPWQEVSEGAEQDGHRTMLGSDELPKRQFVQAAHDFCPNSFARLICLVVQHVQALHGAPGARAENEIAEALQRGFAAQPTSVRPITELQKNFFEFLNLPIWKKRHELYSVWVASQISNGLRHLDWDWHPDGDTLRFPFSGAHLATLRSATSTYQFWTEMRSALPTSGVFGRRNIQPDYRVVAAPVHRPAATVLVVECKQYQTANRRNFSSALDDYA